MATPVGFDVCTYIHTYNYAGHFRWPCRSFSMAAPVAAMAAPVAAIATHLCPYEAQYKCIVYRLGLIHKLELRTLLIIVTVYKFANPRVKHKIHWFMVVYFQKVILWEVKSLVYIIH